MKPKIYYRIITERLPHNLLKKELKYLKKVVTVKYLKQELSIFSISFLALSLSILVLYVTISYIKFVGSRDNWLRANDNLIYWRQVAEKQGNSPDAYYQAGLAAATLGENSKAYEYLQKALSLDPDFDKARLLENKLGSE